MLKNHAFIVRPRISNRAIRDLGYLDSRFRFGVEFPEIAVAVPLAHKVDVIATPNGRRIDSQVFGELSKGFGLRLIEPNVIRAASFVAVPVRPFKADRNVRQVAL